MTTATQFAEAPAKKTVGFGHILFTTDFSDSSLTAFPFAVALTRIFDAKLYLTHIVTPEAYQIVPPNQFDGALEQCRREAEAQMIKLDHRPELDDLQHTPLVAVGEMGETLAKLVKENAIDLIITGTHGRTGWQHMVMGSVTEEILRQAPCPVLTIGPHVKKHPVAVIAPRHILFPTDLSPASRIGAPFAVALAAQSQAKLTLLHVLPAVTGLNPDLPALLKPLYQELTRLAEAEVKDEKHAPECLIEFGETPETIARVAQAKDSDMIVLGVRRGHWLETHLGSTVAYKVLLEAECPVLTVHGE